VQRNFECEPAEPTAIPTFETVPAAGLLLSGEAVTGGILVGATLCKSGQYFRRAVDQQSPGLAGEK
jgi:hypothetical protein